MNYLASKFVENNLEKDFVKPIVPSYNGKTLPTVKELKKNWSHESGEIFEEQYSQTFDIIINDIEENSIFFGTFTILKGMSPYILFVQHKNAELRKPWTHFGIYFGRFFGHSYHHIYLLNRLKNDLKNIGYNSKIKLNWGNNQVYWELKE